MKISKLTDFEKETFEKHFADEQGTLNFEGMWLRNQRKENARQSGWVDENTARRRYIHFFDNYIVDSVGKKHYLSLNKAYVFVTNTLPKIEIKQQKASVLNALSTKGYTQTSSNVFEKDGFEVLIFEYDNHPKNKEFSVSFPNDYASLDVVFRTKDNDYQSHYNRMWKHSTKMFRLPQLRQNPSYETDLSKLKQFLPAQIEMGCGPSIEAKIPPLYEMHELYKVQNHETGKFYFSQSDDLMESIILNTEKMFKKFGAVALNCLKAEHTKAYLSFADAYKKGLFIGTVYNNNFDRLVKRLDIPEKILRIFDKDKYLPKITFKKEAKSLICFGTHADRREVQKQAREQGLKVIFVDPEGFYDEGGNFEEYPLEAPQNQDIIYKMTFDEFMKKFKKEFLN